MAGLVPASLAVATWSEVGGSSVAVRVSGGKFGKGREKLAGEGSFPAIGCVCHIVKNSWASFLTEEACMGGGMGRGWRLLSCFFGDSFKRWVWSFPGSF